MFKHKETQVRDVARPATGKTPVRGIRVPDGIWNAAQEKAAAEGRTMTDVLTDYLRRYITAPTRAKPGAVGADAGGRRAGEPHAE